MDVMRNGQLLDQSGRYKYSLTYEIRGLALTAAIDPKLSFDVFQNVSISASESGHSGYKPYCARLWR